MDEGDQFSISMSQGLWYKLGPVVYYFFRRDRTEKNVSEKRLLGPIHVWYLHTCTYISVCVDVNVCVCMCIYIICI